MTTLSGYVFKQNKGLALIKPLLPKWIKVMEQYNIDTSGDHIYWYNERANVSALAGAAWKCNYSAICEFQHDKKFTENKNKSKKKEYVGRCDLYIQAKSDDFYAEAKFERLSLNPKLSWEEKLGKSRELAMDDAAKTKNGEDINVLGVSFYAFDLPSGQQDKLESKITNLINFLKQKPYDAIAWYFPEDQRCIQPEYHNNIKPGVVMVIESVEYLK